MEIKNAEMKSNLRTHNLGLPRIGAKRELKRALESSWAQLGATLFCSVPIGPPSQEPQLCEASRQTDDPPTASHFRSASRWQMNDFPIGLRYAE